MAPPKSRSFSVRVVLPASGCEMIAKVRRRRISAARSLMALKSIVAGAAAVQRELEDGCILAAIRRLIVAAPGTDVLELKRLIEANGRGVRWPHFKIGHVHRRRGGALQQVLEEECANTAAAQLRLHAQVQDMGLPRARAHYAVSGHAVEVGCDTAHIADSQAVTKDGFAPRETVGGNLNGDYRRHIGLRHGADV